MAEDTPTEDDLVRIMDEWVDDLAPLNRGAFKFAARAIAERYPLGLTVQPTVEAEVKAQAWDEGCRHRWRRGPDDCRCDAWSSIECACGKYGTGDLLSLEDNPYRFGEQP